MSLLFPTCVSNQRCTAEQARAKIAARLKTAAPIHDAIDSARAVVNTEPTPAQREVGNYSKGHVAWNGLEISIENPKGSTRSGIGAGGKRWSTLMQHDYGYFRRAPKACDGDHVDVFIGPHPESHLVYIVDQQNKDGSFDEFKVLIGFLNKEEAKEGYLCNYEDGWKGLQSITSLTLEQFKDWLLTEGNKHKPYAKAASLSPEQQELMDKGHGKKIYSCKHTSRCRCLHGSELPTQYLDGPCPSCREKTAVEIPLPDVDQETGHSCGTASLAAIESHYGDTPQTEEPLRKEVKPTPEKGTSPPLLVQQALEDGYHVEPHLNMGLVQLLKYLTQRIPVIVAIQAYGDQDHTDDDSGHYVVAKGVENGKLLFEDPAIKDGHSGELPLVEFLKRWHDKSGDGVDYPRMGIAVWKDKPAENTNASGTAKKIAAHRKEIEHLREAKLRSDAKDYAGKNSILREMMKAAPNEWSIDSVGHMLGITHNPTGFRFHTKREVVPPSVKESGDFTDALRVEPLRLSPRLGLVGNVIDHVQRVQNRGQQIATNRENFQQLQSAMNPGHGMQEFLKDLGGRRPQTDDVDQFLLRFPLGQLGIPFARS